MNALGACLQMKIVDLLQQNLKQVTVVGDDAQVSLWT
jgi:hypothetical protein